MSLDNSEEELVTINAGGIQYTTYKTTLTRLSPTLESLFRITPADSYFLDIDGIAFGQVLTYLRHNILPTKLSIEFKETMKYLMIEYPQIPDEEDLYSAIEPIKSLNIEDLPNAFHGQYINSITEEYTSKFKVEYLPNIITEIILYTYEIPYQIVITGDFPNEQGIFVFDQPISEISKEVIQNIECKALKEISTKLLSNGINKIFIPFDKKKYIRHIHITYKNKDIKNIIYISTDRDNYHVSNIWKIFSVNPPIKNVMINSDKYIERIIIYIKDDNGNYLYIKNIKLLIDDDIKYNSKGNDILSNNYGLNYNKYIYDIYITSQLKSKYYNVELDYTTTNEQCKIIININTNRV